MCGSGEVCGPLSTPGGKSFQPPRVQEGIASGPSGLSTVKSLRLPVACLPCCVSQAGCRYLWASWEFYKEGVWLCSVAGFASFFLSAQFPLLSPVGEKASFCCSETWWLLYQGGTCLELAPAEEAQRSWLQALCTIKMRLDAQLGGKLPGEKFLDS